MTRWGAAVLDRLPLRRRRARPRRRAAAAAASRSCSPSACRAVASSRSTGRRRWSRPRASGSRRSATGSSTSSPTSAGPLPIDGPVDAILSTATFHWVPDHDALFANLAAVLRPGGRLVAQCGGAGNIASVQRGARDDRRRLARRRRTSRRRWRPSRRLDAAGFVDIECWLTDEPTRFEPGEPFETYLRTVVLGAAPRAAAAGERARRVRPRGRRPAARAGRSTTSGSTSSRAGRARLTDRRRRQSRTRNAAPWPGMTMSAAARTRARPRSMRGLVGAQRVDLGRPVRAPPQVGHGVDAVVGLDDERRVLLGVAGRQPQLAVRAEVVAVAVVVEPQVVAVARPEVDHLGVREQRDVDRVVRVVMAQEDVRDGLGCDAEVAPADRGSASAGRPSRVDHDQRVAVADEHDAAADAIGGVAGVEQVDGRHRRHASPVAPLAAGVATDGMAATARDRVSSSAACRTDRPADLVLRGGRIATMDAARTLAAALAVRDGRIVAVGSDAAVGRLDRAAQPGRRAPRPDRHPGLR